MKFSDPSDKLRPWLAAFAAAVLFGTAGCATGPNVHPLDPFEPLNREVLRFNEGVDAVVLRPTATFYREYVPPLVRTGVSNFVGNLSDAWSAVNSGLQLKIQNAAENWMRFSVNTVFGLGGILDIASEMNIERHREDFGQTLGRWGVPTGPYIVLPVLGSSTLRDTLALPIDRQGDPIRELSHASTRYALYIVRAVDVRHNLLRASDVLDGAALDRYSFIRDAYLQRRRAEVFESGQSGSRSEDPNDGSDGSDGNYGSDSAPAPGAPPDRGPVAPPGPAPGSR